MAYDLKTKLAQLKELHELGYLDEQEYRDGKKAAVAAAMGGHTGAIPASPVSAGNLLSGATVARSAPPGPPPQSPSQPSLSGATTVSSHSGLPSQVGSYRVLGLVGRGGMGSVFRARHLEEGWASKQGGDVALKLIHPHIASDPAFRERFLTEAALGRRLQHPGLATVYDVVADGPWLGVTLEFVDGRELTEWVRPGGLAVSEVVGLLAPLADALDHLHGEGIVHRDLKPANVKVRSDGRPVLLDLGIAKDLSGDSGSHTQTMTAMGTSAWMAPEQADAKRVTKAADIYALGLVAYALLSGQMPWPAGESELRVLTNKMMGKLEPLSNQVPTLPVSVSDAVMAALSMDPGARPETCSSLVSKLSIRPKVNQTSTPSPGPSGARRTSRTDRSDGQRGVAATSSVATQHGARTRFEPATARHPLSPVPRPATGSLDRAGLKELARAWRAEHPTRKRACPLCGVEVRPDNLLKHYDKNHASVGERSSSGRNVPSATGTAPPTRRRQESSPAAEDTRELTPREQIKELAREWRRQAPNREFACPVCSAPVRPKNLVRHYDKQHSGASLVRRSVRPISKAAAKAGGRQAVAGGKHAAPVAGPFSFLTKLFGG